MIIFENIYNQLNELLGGELDSIKADTEFQNRILKADGYMDLHIEWIGKNRLSMTHYYRCNGDSVTDPEVVVEISPDIKMAEGISFEQGGVLYYDVYTYDESGTKVGLYPKRKRELNEFLKLWLNNLKNQGFFGQVPLTSNDQSPGKRPSDAQEARQKKRGQDGKYEKMYKCEICNKGVGENYYSDHRVDSLFKGLGLSLCKKDMIMLDSLSDEDALKLLQEADAKRQQNMMKHEVTG